MDTILKKGLTGKIFLSEKDLKGNKTEDVTGRSQLINFCNRRWKKSREKVVHASSDQLNYVIWAPRSLTCRNLSVKRFYFILPQFPHLKNGKIWLMCHAEWREIFESEKQLLLLFRRGCKSCHSKILVCFSGVWLNPLPSLFSAPRAKSSCCQLIFQTVRFLHKC